jgi:hypothetical protein
VPTAASIAPSSGPQTGGNTVTITGTGFTGATAVTYGGTPAPSFTVVSDTQITAVAPAGTGTVSVTVTTAGGTSNGISYTYVPAPVISSAVLNIGPETGGNTVTITGTGYTGATSVNFGATPAISFTVVSDTEITATAPAGAGTVLLTVTTIGGTSNGVAYTYVPAPAITAIVPSAGPVTGDNTVTITGTGFTWAASVHFGAAPATSFTVVSDTQIIAVAPAGTGTVSTTVTTAGGTSNGISYTYIPAPVIDSVEPDKGPAAGNGESVGIYGSCFTGTISVTFGGKPAVSFFVFEEGWILAVPPAGAAGKVAVTVTTPYGSATKPDAYTYIPVPAITSVSPDRGPLTGGAAVTISGTGFTGTTEVTFGSAAASYTVVSDTQIDAVTPAGSGTVSVTVTTAGGTGTAVDAYIYLSD